ncbi:MAG: DNA-3-methyladenine glycosylase [Candidatus Andersenbacteria bacterium]
MKNVLQRSFYDRDTHDAAKNLLGKVLVRRYGKQLVSGRISEVEAYVGEDDLACHASKGRTARTDIMFGKAGHAYIYLIYGMYHCFNVVTEQEHFPAAVLIRSVEPLDGVSVMQQRRGTHQLNNLTTGPGKLCRALSITKKLNGVDVTESNEIYIVDDGFVVHPNHIATSKRIGVEYARHCTEYPWRYYLKNSNYLSRT